MQPCTVLYYSTVITDVMYFGKQNETFINMYCIETILTQAMNIYFHWPCSIINPNISKLLGNEVTSVLTQSEKREEQSCGMLWFWGIILLISSTLEKFEILYQRVKTFLVSESNRCIPKQYTGLKSVCLRISLISFAIPTNFYLSFLTCKCFQLCFRHGQSTMLKQILKVL